MGEAILAALLANKLCKPSDVAVSDIIEPRRQLLKQKYGVTVTADTKTAIKGREVVVLAVKPQNVGDVFTGLKGNLQPEQVILSIAAGVRIATIIKGTGHDKVVRSMPNTPAQIGLGISGWAATPQVTDKQKKLARSILKALGKEIYFNEEEYLDKVTAISGSGPAYIYLFAESLIDGAIELGLTKQDAEVLVLQTILGAAHLMDKSDKTPADLRRNVTSKGGTTERAIAVFEQNDLAGIVAKAVKAALQRAQELGEVKS